MSKYPENKPFGEWTPEQQRNFKIDVLVDGKEYEHSEFVANPVWMPGDVAFTGGAFFGRLCYRLAPEPETDDSIDWSHVHPDYVKMVSHAGAGYVFLYGKSSGKEIIGFAQDFASYKRGNKPSSTVYRPGFEPEEAK